LFPRPARYAQRSLPGLSGPNNDATLVLDTSSIAAVFDGMTTYSVGVGEFARQSFIDGLAAARGHMAEMLSPPGAELLFPYAARRASAAMVERARSDPRFARDGATFCAIAIEHEHAVIAHAGECRAYRLASDDSLYSCTIDHTLASERLLIAPGDTANINLEAVITRAWGVEPYTSCDLAIEQIYSGTVFLLCTNGLPARVTFETMRAASILARTDVDAASAMLEASASASDHWDDASWVLVSVR